jgi:hypothetical protein
MGRKEKCLQEFGGKKPEEKRPSGRPSGRE